MKLYRVSFHGSSEHLIEAPTMARAKALFAAMFGVPVNCRISASKVK